jgi:hypothetical protein
MNSNSLKRPIGRPRAHTIARCLRLTLIADEHCRALCKEQKISPSKLVIRLIEEAFISSRRYV